VNTVQREKTLLETRVFNAGFFYQQGQLIYFAPEGLQISL
jgi:hypothetical protein